VADLSSTPDRTGRRSHEAGQTGSEAEMLISDIPVKILKRELRDRLRSKPFPATA
jgi:hypothetical protein